MNSLRLHQLTKEIFDVMQSIGEVLHGDAHIIELEKSEGATAYRMYHANGVCFDVRKTYECAPGESKDLCEALEDGYAYSFFDEWESFTRISEQCALALVRLFRTDLQNALDKVR